MSGIAYCGIDFGVDCCGVAICKDAFPAKTEDGVEVVPLSTRPTASVVENVLGERSTPTYIQCPQNSTDTFVVGATARDQSQRCTKRTVNAIKLALGKTLSEVQNEIKNKVWTCDIIETKNKELAFNVIEPRAKDPESTKNTFTATSLATNVFKQLLSDAASNSGKDIKGCVLAVHPNATEKENAALVTSAKNAGFEEIALLTTDVAVALAYGFDQVVTEETDATPETSSETKEGSEQKEDEDADEDEEEAAIITSPVKRILILDVGARSSTASLLLATNGLLQTIHTVTEANVGGDYIDEALVALCASQFKRTSKGLDVTVSIQSDAKQQCSCSFR